MAAVTSTTKSLPSTRAQSPDLIRPSQRQSNHLHSLQNSLPGSGVVTARGSARASLRASSSAFHIAGVGSQKYFRSRRIDPGELSKPWTEKKDPHKKWHCIFPLIGILLGIAAVGATCWQGYMSVINHHYCSIYDEDFSSGQLDEKIWTKEVEVGGYGNGQFEMTTNTDENVFVRDGELWIKPTLQDENLVNHNTVLNLTQQGICTSKVWMDCHAATNTTNGTIVNPVKSARINTKKSINIQYGRVEVVAKLPAGDWMWPAIWMLPVNDTYGPWPASGEIDIAESRGNNYSYPLGGNDIISSTLHWGPNSDQDAWYRSFAKKTAKHTTYAAQYHKFGLEWSEKYMFTYINDRLIEALYVPFTTTRWPLGDFDTSTENGTQIVDPWSQTGRDSTPFDQPFYLILNVAVGSTNAWWTDGLDGKPWVDASPTAMKEFWDARTQWYPTWSEGGHMQIKSVKIWQQGGYRGCPGS